MTRNGITLALGASLALAGCFEQPEMPKPVASRLPDAVCKQVREALVKLEESGTVQRAKPAEIVMEEQAWLQLPESSREQITKAIGFEAACQAAEPPMEQTVIVRSEFGRVMAQPIITTSADLSAMLQE
jgi:hypothetical protein